MWEPETEISSFRGVSGSRFVSDPEVNPQSKGLSWPLKRGGVLKGAALYPVTSTMNTLNALFSGSRGLLYRHATLVSGHGALRRDTRTSPPPCGDTAIPYRDRDAEQITAD